MAIDQDYFSQWVETRFGRDNYYVKELQVNLHSPFTEKKDDGFHLWCCPELNAFHCWKTGKSGNLYELISEFEPCSYADAVELLGGNQYLKTLEDKIQKFFQTKPKEVKKSSLSLPPGTKAIHELPDGIRENVQKYLQNRKLDYNNLYYCTEGKYAKRIIIPYYDSNRNLIYFNGRDITNKSYLRYKGPEKGTVGIGKGDVVWMSSYPDKGEKVYLTEGEFDAMSLKEAGFVSAALGGKNLNPKQIKLLFNYRVVFAFDLDKYGREAIQDCAKILRSFSGMETYFILPPVGYKDWNELLIKKDKKAISNYINKYERVLEWNDLFQI